MENGKQAEPYGRYKLRDCYKDAIDGFISSVNGSLEGITIRLADKYTKEGIRPLSGGNAPAGRQSGQYLMIGLGKDERSALVIYAPSFSDDPGKQAPEKTLRFKKCGDVNGIALVRFAGDGEPLGHPDPELDMDMHVASSRLVNQTSFKPLFEPKRGAGPDGRPKLPSLSEMTALTRDGADRKPRGERHPVDKAYQLALGSTDARFIEDYGELMAKIDGAKDPTAVASAHMLRLAAATRAEDLGIARGGEGDKNSDAWKALGLDALYGVLSKASEEISAAGEDGPDYSRIFGESFGSGAERDTRALMGLCSLAVYRRCRRELSGSVTLGDPEGSISAGTFELLGSASTMNARERETEELGAIYAEELGNAEACYPKYMLKGAVNERRYDDCDLYRQWRAEKAGNGATAYDPGLLDMPRYTVTRDGAVHTAAGDMKAEKFAKSAEAAAKFPALALAASSGEGKSSLASCVKAALGKDESIDIAKAELQAFKENTPPEERQALADALKGRDGISGGAGGYDIDEGDLADEGDPAYEASPGGGAAPDGGVPGGGRSLIEVAEEDLAGVPDEPSGSLSFGWLARKACARAEADNPLRAKDDMMKSFDPSDPAYAACTGYIRDLCEEHAEGGGIRAGAKLNDFMAMMDVYRPDTEEGIAALRDDIESMHAGAPKADFLYRPASAAEVRILKALISEGSDIREFRGISNKGNGFAEALSATIEKDSRQGIDTDRILDAARLEAVSADTMIRHEASDLIGTIRKAADERDRTIERSAEAVREFKASRALISDDAADRPPLLFSK